MKLFDYVIRMGTLKRGVLPSESRESAVLELKNGGAQIIRVEPLKDFLGIRAYLYKLKTSHSKKTIAQFFELMSYMLGTGIPLHNALLMLQSIGAGKKLQALSRPLMQPVIHGAQLSEALSKAGFFSKSIIMQIESGERSNTVPEALTGVSTALNRELQFHAKVKNAMVYPCIVLVVLAVVLWGLMTLVVPTLATALESLGGELPWLTQQVIGASKFTLVSTPYILMFVVTAVLGYKGAYRRVEAFSLAVDRLKIKVPILGQFITKVEMSRFCRNLSAMLSCGTPLYRAVSMARETLNNQCLQRSIGRAVQEIELKGASLPAALSGAEGVPPMVSQFLEIAVPVGKVTEMLTNISDRYEVEIDNMTKRITTLVEPMLIVVVAVIVGVVVISMYMPMWSLIDSLG